MDQNNNPEIKVTTEPKKMHRIGKAEYELTPGIGENKDWVSFEEACLLLTLKIDQIRKLSATLGWPKKYDMAGRVLNTFVPKQSVVDYLHTKNFHEPSDAEHRPASPEGGDTTQNPQEHHGAAGEPIEDKIKLPLQIQNEFKELRNFREFATGYLKKQDEKINSLEAKTEALEIKKEELSKELMNEKEEKSNLKIKSNNLKFYLIIAAIAIAVGGGVAAYFVISTNNDNDRLYEARKQDKSTIIDLNMDDSNQKVKVKDLQDQVDFFKKTIPTVQNEEINAVKKD